MEFIVIGDDEIRSSMKSSFPVSFHGNIMQPAESVKSLGVILDADNSMQIYMANLCCTCYYHLQELRRIIRYLNHETAVKVANTWITVIHCFITQRRHILSDYKEFKMPYVILCTNSINLVMSHTPCINYTRSSFIIVYCSSTTSSLIKP